MLGLPTHEDQRNFHGAFLQGVGNMIPNNELLISQRSADAEKVAGFIHADNDDPVTEEVPQSLIGSPGGLFIGKVQDGFDAPFPDRGLKDATMCFSAVVGQNKITQRWSDMKVEVGFKFLKDCGFNGDTEVPHKWSLLSM